MNIDYTKTPPTEEGFYWFKSPGGFVAAFSVTRVDFGDAKGAFLVVETEYRSRGCNELKWFVNNNFEFAPVVAPLPKA